MFAAAHAVHRHLDRSQGRHSPLVRELSSKRSAELHKECWGRICLSSCMAQEADHEIGVRDDMAHLSGYQPLERIPRIVSS